VAIETNHVYDMGIVQGLQDEANVVKMVERAPECRDEVSCIDLIVVSTAGPVFPSWVM